MDNQTGQALQNLLAGNASADEIEMLKQRLVSGQVSIGGNVSQSVIILGDGNTVQLTPQALDAINGRSLLGDLERDLTGAEIEHGLIRLEELLPERAPILKSELDKLTHRLRPTLQTNLQALSTEARQERTETLARLNRLCMEITEIAFNALCTGAEPPVYDARCPFRGLESFRPEDAEYFFGREELTQKLVYKINEHNFLAVLGISGSGKSSLVMAGLVPALNFPYAVFRPSMEPLSELTKALQGNPELLVVDQFEELFTLSAQEQRAEFISCLLEYSKKLRIVITMRADFLGEVAPFKSLRDEVQNHQEIIPPMDENELHQAMEGQADFVGLRFESDLSQQMLDDVSGEPGAMPLLQHALWTLWTRRHGRWLRADEYRAFGGVKQAIASTAEMVFAHCSELERTHLRDIFLRLTRLGEGTDGRDTRRRVLLHDLIPADSDPAAITLLVKRLADARLVVTSTGVEVSAQTEVEVAHEALIRHWERLRGWLNDDRANLHLRESVSDDARHWDNASRDETLLNHRGARLELALAMSKNPGYRLNPVEQAYLDECVNMRDKEAKSRRLRFFSIVGVILIALVLVSISITLAITGQWSRITHPPLPMEWIEIPAGNFLMGSSDKELADALEVCPSCALMSEQPQHLVYLVTYQIEKYEVTNQQYNQCVLADVCNRPTNSDYNKVDLQNHPVTDITWKDALTFCEWSGGRLPTEAEWEKAARGPSTENENPRIYPWGDQWDMQKANGAQGEKGRTMPVGFYTPRGDSIYGVSDMSGNVWEWVMDWYAEDYYTHSPSQNPQGPETGSYRVLRGGSFANSAVDARAAYRGYNPIGNISNDIGFRCTQ